MLYHLKTNSVYECHLQTVQKSCFWKPFKNHSIWLSDTIPPNRYQTNLVFKCRMKCFWELIFIIFGALSCSAMNLILCLTSLLGITVLIASLLHQECKQAIISSMEDKQSIKFKAGEKVLQRNKNYCHALQTPAIMLIQIGNRQFIDFFDKCYSIVTCK